MISLPFKITTVYSSCLLNLGHCLLLFINDVVLKVGSLSFESIIFLLIYFLKLLESTFYNGISKFQ